MVAHIAPAVTGPAAYPMTPPGDDARFTYEMVTEVGKVLAEHGYPPIDTAADLVRLGHSLFGFFYASASASSAESSLANHPADPGTTGGQPA